MAALSRQQQPTGLDLGPTPPPTPPPVLPLRALLEAVPAKVRDEAALRLARGMGWAAELIATRISLGKGDYRLSIDGRGAHLLASGYGRATRIDGTRGNVRSQVRDRGEFPGRTIMKGVKAESLQDCAVRPALSQPPCAGAMGPSRDASASHPCLARGRSGPEAVGSAAGHFDAGASEPMVIGFELGSNERRPR